MAEELEDGLEDESANESADELANAKRVRTTEARESIVLALVGALGILAGARSLVPVPTVARPPPFIEAPAGGWPELPATSERVVDYRLEAKLDPVEHVIDGRGVVTFTNTSRAPVDELRFHLYLNAFKNDQTVFRRARVGTFRGDKKGIPGTCDVKKLTVAVGDGAPVDLWPQHEFVSHLGESPQDPYRERREFPLENTPDDETDLRIPLGDRPIPPKGTARVEVEWRDVLPEISERTGYAGTFHFAGQWFPKLARLEPDGTWANFPFHHLGEFYSDYGSYDVTLDVPASYVIGASGAAIESKVEAGRRVERHVLDDVHDFAFTAWDRFVVREAQEGGVKIRHLAPPGYERATDREIVSVQHGLRDLGARFGAYPYPILTVVHPPADAEEAGGMEYPTLITSGGPWWPSHGSHEVEAVTVHELGHQWFYGLIGTHEVEWPSGDEGFNSFAELLAMDRLYGAGGAVAIAGFGLDERAVFRRGAHPPFDEPIFQPTWAFANGGTYAARVYDATALVLDTLRRTYGPVFDQAMGVYARRFRFRHPTSEDFFATLREVVGEDCEDVARALLTTASTLDFYVDAVISEKKHEPAGVFALPSGTVTRKADQGDRGWANMAWVGRHGVADLPVDVELRFGDGSRKRQVVRFGPPPNSASVAPPDAGNLRQATEWRRASTWRRIDADATSELVAVIVDPDRKVSIDANRLNDFGSTHGHAGGAPIARERALAWMETFARAVGP